MTRWGARGPGIAWSLFPFYTGYAGLFDLLIQLPVHVAFAVAPGFRSTPIPGVLCPGHLAERLVADDAALAHQRVQMPLEDVEIRLADADPPHAEQGLARPAVGAGAKPDTHLAKVLNLITYKDPLDFLDPFKDIDRAGLSTIGIVHLFRQYFFEFDTFLDPR